MKVCILFSNIYNIYNTYILFSSNFSEKFCHSAGRDQGDRDLSGEIFRPEFRRAPWPRRRTSAAAPPAPTATPPPLYITTSLKHTVRGVRFPRSQQIGVLYGGKSIYAPQEI